MSLKKEIILSLIVLVAIALISIAYVNNDANFWKYHDTGFLMIAVSMIVASQPYHILTMILWLLFAGTFNSWITSMFFDVTKYEANQVIFSWVLSGVLLITGVGHTCYDYISTRKKKKEQLQCKRDSRKKYRDMITRIDTIEDKLELKSEALRTIFDNLLNDEIHV